MATPRTISTRRDPFRGNLTLGSPFEQPGTSAAAPVPTDAISRLRSLNALAPEQDGIVGMQGADGGIMLTNRSSTIRGMGDEAAAGAFDGMSGPGRPSDLLAEFSAGARNTFRADRLNRSADEAFDAQQAQQRVLAQQRSFERGQKAQDLILEARARGKGETDAFHTYGAQRMREEQAATGAAQAQIENAGKLADAEARMYAADRTARAREAGIPAQEIGAYADVIGATDIMGESGAPLRQQAHAGIARASGQQVATEEQLAEYAARTGRDIEDARALATANGFMIVP